MMENTTTFHPNNSNNNNNNSNNSSSNNIVIGSSRGSSNNGGNDGFLSTSPVSSNSSGNTPPIGTPLKPSTSMTSFTPSSSNTYNENSLLFGMDDQIGMNSSPNGKFSSGSRNDFNRRRKQQSKSQSYSNFNNLLPELLKQEEELKSEHDYIVEFCLVLKERLKQLSIQLEYDLSEIEHKDQEIDLMKSKINKYNMEIREKEEENETLQEQIKVFEKENKEYRDEVETLKNEIKTFETDWIQPQEIFQWKDQIDKITFDMERKQQDLEDLELRYEASTKRIEILTDQIRRERDIHKEENERVQQKLKTDREFTNTITQKLTNKKKKNLLLNEKIKKLQSDLESLQKNQGDKEHSYNAIIEKFKLQAQTSEKETIGLRHTVEKLQQQLLESQTRYDDLSNSQQIINNQLAQNETERQAIIGLINKTELEGDENLSILMKECSNANETITNLKATIKQLENQLNDERLTRQISSISLINNNYTLNERDLIRMVQEKDEEIQRCNKHIQRLCIDNNSLKARTKKFEESSLETSEQLKATKELLSSYKRDVFKIKEELLLIWDDHHNDSIDSGSDNGSNSGINNSTSNSINSSNGIVVGQDLIVKRKSADISEISKILSENDQLFNDNYLSPIKTPTKQRSLSMRQPFSPISPTPSNSSFFSPNNKINSNSKYNSTPTKTLKEQQIIEDMLDKARTANLGYRLHIQFLTKELKNYEQDLDQQKELSSSIISRLQLDLEDSKRQISRMKKTFLQRFSKEDDTLFLDYFSIFPHKSGISNSNDNINNNNNNNNNNNYSSSPNNNSNNNFSSSPSTSYGNTASAPASLLTTPSVGNTASNYLINSSGNSSSNSNSSSSISSLRSSFQSLSINSSQNLNNDLNSPLSSKSNSLSSSSSTIQINNK